ncbi:hypothetical protein AVEN_264788-1 [Araneus ventricosus]|uniref:Uncharacterized protein n=1 Tax=Araneus ventricosus TaxID=182803 RepID=A0A4Y2TY83_ARAVE|nr:hypothetical protein AVEN_264788-1 [Araneus ventricosus]
MRTGKVAKSSSFQSEGGSQSLGDGSRFEAVQVLFEHELCQVAGDTRRSTKILRLLKFHPLLKGTPRTSSNEVLRDNFVRTAVESSKLAPFQPRKVNFEKLEERFSRPVQRGLRNTDVRTGFCWNDHTFLVKAYFTFRQRTVPQGQKHVYQTTDTPMLFYKLNNGSSNSSFRVEDCWFHRLDQYVYDQYVLQPNSTYAVPEYTTYTILTMQKTLFSVHVLPMEALLAEWKQPDVDRHLLGAAPPVAEMEKKRR